VIYETILTCILQEYESSNDTNVALSISTRYFLNNSFIFILYNFDDPSLIGIVVCDYDEYDSSEEYNADDGNFDYDFSDDGFGFERQVFEEMFLLLKNWSTEYFSLKKKLLIFESL